jgi:hypothetical protein
MLNTPSRASMVRRYAPARELHFQSHAEPRLCYVMRGNFEESIGARRYERRHGMILYRASGSKSCRAIRSERINVRTAHSES